MSNIIFITNKMIVYCFQIMLIKIKFQKTIHFPKKKKLKVLIKIYFSQTVFYMLQAIKF